MIPEKLKNQNFSFIRLNGKIPIEKGWQKEKKYSYQDISETKTNIGIVCGFGDLLVLDFDDKKTEEEYIKKLPPTFSVKTGSGGRHLYYLTDDTQSQKILDQKKNTLIDIQGTGKQVVCPPSIHPKTTKKYIVEKDLDIKWISRKQLNAILYPLLKKSSKERQRTSFSDEIKKQVSLEQVLFDFGIDISRNPTECLWHTSRGKSCFSFSPAEQLFFCFHCDKGGDIINFVQEEKNLDFKSACNFLIKKYNLDIKIEDKIISSESETELKEQINSLRLQKKDVEAKNLLVSYFIKNYYFKTLRDDIIPEVYLYEKGVYKANGIFRVKEKLNKIFGKELPTTWVNEIIDGIKYSTGVEKKDFFKETTPEKLPVENGVLDLTTFELEDFTPQYFFFNKLPVEYNPNAKCPKIENFLSDLVESEEEKEILYEIIAFVIYKKYFIEKAVMLNGKGRNGKSKYISLVKAFLGEENFTGIPLQDLEEKPFTINELFKRMANLAGEISKKALTSTNIFKSLTGRDFITADRKFKNRVSFENYAKLIFSCNELPLSFDDTEAFWDRWVLIKFPYKFIEKEEYGKLPNKQNYKIKNPFIMEEITTPEELSGLLNVALQKLKKLIEQQDFTISTTQKTLIEYWKLHTNSFEIFLQEKTKRLFDNYVKKTDLLMNYNIFCFEKKVKPTSSKLIRSTLEKNGFWETRKIIDGSNQTVVMGISLEIYE